MVEFVESCISPVRATRQAIPVPNKSKVVGLTLAWAISLNDKYHSVALCNDMCSKKEKLKLK